MGILTVPNFKCHGRDHFQPFAVHDTRTDTIYVTCGPTDDGLDEEPKEKGPKNGSLAVCVLRPGDRRANPAVAGQLLTAREASIRMGRRKSSIEVDYSPVAHTSRHLPNQSRATRPDAGVGTSHWNRYPSPSVCLEVTPPTITARP
jgi:hypothetical protein